MNYMQLFTEPRDATTTHRASLCSHLSAAPAFTPGAKHRENYTLCSVTAA